MGGIRAEVVLEALAIGSVQACRGILVDAIDGVSGGGAHLVTIGRS